LQEQRSIAETLKSIGISINSQEGLSKEALTLRLSEQYVKALDEVYSDSNIVVVPEINSSL
jgi:hypothetical protein